MTSLLIWDKGLELSVVKVYDANSVHWRQCDSKNAGLDPALTDRGILPSADIGKSFKGCVFSSDAQQSLCA